MSIKKKTAKTELHPVTFDRFTELGEAHGLPQRISTILQFLMGWVLKHHSMPKLQSTRAIEGGTTLGFIDTLIHEGLKRRGYFRDKRN